MLVLQGTQGCCTLPHTHAKIPIVTNRPHDNCYWVVPGRLMAGEYPGAATADDAQLRLAAISAVGVRHFVDLTAPHELQPYDSMLREISPPAGAPSRV